MAGIPVPNSDDFYAIKKQGRFFALYERGDQLIWEEGPQEDRLVCICVYKKGAEEVRRRLLSKGTGHRNGSTNKRSPLAPRIPLDQPLSDSAGDQSLCNTFVSDAIELRDESEEPA